MNMNELLTAGVYPMPGELWKISDLDDNSTKARGWFLYDTVEQMLHSDWTIISSRIISCGDVLVILDIIDNQRGQGIEVMTKLGHGYVLLISNIEEFERISP